MADATTTEEKVPNPAYQDLVELRGRVAQAAPALRAALDKPARDMGSAEVWTGPAATTFAAELTGRKQRLATLVEDLVASVDAKLRATPRECTRQEAQNYHRWRRIEGF